MTANEILEDACESKIACANEKDLLIIIAELMRADAGLSVETILANACISRVACLQEKDLLIVMAQSLSE